jgi:Tfp pilus assembly pilus retraction ATPase PilT
VTITRIIDVFPRINSQIRTQLSNVLAGVMCQQLTKADGQGAVSRL